MDQLAAVIPRGEGRGGVWDLHGRAELDKLLAGGAGYAVARGHGGQRDLDRCEDHGVAGDADPAQVSSRAMDRGLGQVGSLGSGNHFLEVQAVDQVYDPAAAEAFGLAEGQVCVMIHCGSRGLGHQICTDQVQIMDTAMARYGITVPDRQLACAPVGFARRAAGTWAPWPPPRTTPARTASCSPRRPAGSFADRRATAATWSMTWPTTSPRWKPTQSAAFPPGYASTARARPGRCRPAIPSCPRTCAMPGSRC